jgi:hypothetical protein
LVDPAHVHNVVDLIPLWEVAHAGLPFRIFSNRANGLDPPIHSPPALVANPNPDRRKAINDATSAARIFEFLEI